MRRQIKNKTQIAHPMFVWFIIGQNSSVLVCTLGITTVRVAMHSTDIGDTRVNIPGMLLPDTGRGKRLAAAGSSQPAPANDLLLRPLYQGQVYMPWEPLGWWDIGLNPNDYAVLFLPKAFLTPSHIFPLNNYPSTNI